MTDELEELARRLVTGRKSDGRKVYDERAKAEVVALAVRPGTSVSQLARELDVNANQLSRWIREQGQAGARRGQTKAAPSESVFVPMPIQTPATARNGSAASTLSIQVRMPNGVAVEFIGCELAQAGQLIETLGRLRCSGLKKD